MSGEVKCGLHFENDCESQVEKNIFVRMLIGSDDSVTRQQSPFIISMLIKSVVLNNKLCWS